MNRIVDVFKRPKVLLPVIHAISEGQVIDSAELAIEHGADGLFVINQGGLSGSEVVRVARRLVDSGAPFVGVNLLGMETSEAFAIIAGSQIPALWVDDAGVRHSAACRGERQPWALPPRRAASPWTGLLFGGVAFKYIRPIVPPEHFGEVARLALDCGVDVITTSGPATGEPPAVNKVQAMRHAIGDHALAVASGIRPENVSAFLPFVDAFLVATGIEASFGQFDEVRLHELACTIHEWDQ